MKIVKLLYFKIYNKLKSVFTNHLYSLVATILYAHYYLYDIKIGKKCSFIGIPKITKKGGGSISIGKGCTFRSKSTSNLIGINHRCIIATLDKNAKLVIGENCGFSGTVIGAEKNVTIGQEVRCGANTIICDTDYHSNDWRSGDAREVIIEDGVWLGVNVVVLKGVKIGENSLIGANSVVTNNIPSNVIAAGNPCKVLRKIQC